MSTYVNIHVRMDREVVASGDGGRAGGGELFHYYCVALFAFSPTRSAERTTNLPSITQFFNFFSFSAYLPSLHRLYGPCNPPVLSRLLCLLLSQ